MRSSAGQYAVDPELRAGLETYPGPQTSSVTADMIPALRRSVSKLAPSGEVLRRGGAVDVRELTVPGPEGAPDLSLLVCRPARTHDFTPGVYYIHGGGMLLGDNRLGVAAVLGWVEKIGVTLVSVGYRLAPEHPYPAPQEDCYAGLTWLAEHAADLGIDRRRLLVAGLSAGAGLAAATVLMARDRSGPSLAGQVLMSPMLDDRVPCGAEANYEDDGVFDHTSWLTSWTTYLGDRRGGPSVTSYAAPARASDLSGLPPTYIEVGSAEIVRDQAVKYALRMCKSGGLAELHVWPGGFHGFDQLVPRAAVSRAARAARMDWLWRRST